MASRSYIAALALAALLANVHGAAATQATQAGQFLGRVVVEWLHPAGGEDRDMQLLERFGFRDPTGEEWPVPEGAIINGASIPRVLWTLVGSPFIGDYRRASVVHDYYCQAKSRPWQAVHRMFYDAMLAGGVSTSRAKTMYAVVYGDGPRWEVPGALPALRKRALSEKDASDLQRWIRDADPDLADIERRVMAHVAGSVWPLEDNAKLI